MSSGGTAKTDNPTADVVVIGAGGAGLTAAVAAAERGASILLLEARNAPSGNAVFASGLFTVGSHFEKDLDIVAARDDFLKKAMIRRVKLRDYNISFSEVVSYIPIMHQ